jgi:DNA-binding winged helix-turn-helix (wHTH) protein
LERAIVNDAANVGDLRISPSTLTISRNGSDATLQPLVMDVLCCLAAADGVVRRETLEAVVWKGDHVGYHALPRAVSQARRALDRIGSTVRIEAVPKRGYRLVVEPAEMRRDIAADLSAAEATPPPGRREQRLPTGAWLGLVLAIGLGMTAAGRHGSQVHLLTLALLALLFSASQILDHPRRLR